jgi:hypothetical protein
MHQRNLLPPFSREAWLLQQVQPYPDQRGNTMSNADRLSNNRIAWTTLPGTRVVERAQLRGGLHEVRLSPIRLM